MTKEAVLHKMNLEFLYPLPDNKMLFKIRVKKNDCLKVLLHTVDKYKSLFGSNTIKSSFIMEKVSSDALFDYYESVIELTFLSALYYFEFFWENGKGFYSNYEFFEKEPRDLRFMFIAASHWKEDVFSTPGWLEDAVVYAIFPDRFYREKEKNPNPTDYNDWFSKVGVETVLGGNIKGITAKLDYLSGLGVNVIYLNPVFTSDSNHRYNTFNYYSIDPRLGTLDDFKNLVECAHRLGIKIILDAVFNHTGLDFFAFKDVMEHEKKSPYLDWFHISSFPVAASGDEEPNFKSFAYYYKMPKLNLANEEAAEYFLKVGEYWIKECNIDGWRLDVADEVSHGFWKKFRTRMKKQNKELAIVGEVWYDSSEYLKGDEFDTVMNYPFLYAAGDFLNRVSAAPASSFSNALGHIRGLYKKNVHSILWNIIDSHDTPRFLFNVNEDREKLKMAALLQFTLPGTPVVYYGDEVGMTGGADPDNRRGMLWDETKQAADVLDFYKTIIGIRKKYAPIFKGSFKEVLIDDKNGVYGYERTDGTNTILVILNSGEKSIIFPNSKKYRNLLTGSELTGDITVEKTSGIILKNGI